MKYTKSVILGALLILVSFSFSSCLPSPFGTAASRQAAESKISTTAPVELSTRQREICEELGLSPVFESLTPQQKKCIVRIEELLQYLDNKYDTTFNYLGYKEAFAPAYQKETLEAYSDEFSEYEYTTLTVEKNGSFIDDYPFQFVKRIVRPDFMEYMQENLDMKFKVYVISGRTDIKDVSKLNKETLPGTTEVTCTAFVEQSEDMSVSKIGNAIADWYKSLGIYGNTAVIAINSETFDEITYDNYESIRQKKNLERYLLCKVSKSGDVKID